jgi:Zn-dependent protease with chaperone function
MPEQVDDSVEGDPDAAVEVVYLTEESNGEPRGAKKVFGNVLRTWYFFGIPIMCAWLAIAGRDRIVFTVGTVFGLQMAYIYLRSKRFSGPIIDDPITRSRITPPLEELSAAAGVAVPRVRVKRTAVSAAVTLQNKIPTLWMTPDFLQVTGDSELRAIIAHEVAHIQMGDLAVAQRRRSAMVLTTMAFTFAILIGLRTTGWIPIAILYAFILPIMRLMAIVIGFSSKKYETRADLRGAVLANDAQAMVRGLRLMCGLRPEIQRKIFGPRALRWMLFPYTLPATSHPPLKERVLRLQEMSLPVSTAAPLGFDFDQVKVKRNGVVGGIAVLAAAIALIFALHHISSDAGISPNVQSPHGAHFIPLNVLGIPSTYGFVPLSPVQVPEVTTTAKRAVSIAESTNEIQPSHKFSVTVSEGSFSSFTSPNQAEPAYIVVLSGSSLPRVNGTLGPTKVNVVVDATNDSVITTFWVLGHDEIIY